MPIWHPKHNAGSRATRVQPDPNRTAAPSYVVFVYRQLTRPKIDFFLGSLSLDPKGVNLHLSAGKQPQGNHISTVCLLHPTYLPRISVNSTSQASGAPACPEPGSPPSLTSPSVSSASRRSLVMLICANDRWTRSSTSTISAAV